MIIGQKNACPFHGLCLKRSVTQWQRERIRRTSDWAVVFRAALLSAEILVVFAVEYSASEKTGVSQEGDANEHVIINEQSGNRPETRWATAADTFTQG
jgi:hypothetical protein